LDGTGTLAHELCIPCCPKTSRRAQLVNEGFASLFEQSGDRKADGGLRQLAAAQAQAAAQDQQGNPAGGADEDDDEQFYGEDDRGVHYATARYLCLYLQERQLLIPFFKEFKATAKADPTGAAAMRRSPPDARRAGTFWREWSSVSGTRIEPRLHDHPSETAKPASHRSAISS